MGLNPAGFLYLSRQDVARVAIDPAAARAAVIAGFGAIATGRSAALPKAALVIAPGHAFQAMVAAAPEQAIAGVKWLGTPGAEAGPDVPSVQAVICLNDYTTGALLALMDGDLVTLLRTAAMSAAASSFLGPATPETLGFVGCGAQARAHLAAFRALYPGLRRVVACRRSAASAEALVGLAQGLAGETTGSAEAVLRQSDIVVTTVPASVGFTPFLDPRWLKPDAFVASVDIGRSWLDSGIDEFDVLATDSLAQSDRFPGVGRQPYQVDLAGLAAEGRVRDGGRVMFCFRGFAIADLAVAELVYREALRQGVGTELAR
ncbi:ornithine cyclodeaminase family protein [Acidisphaera sp. L21]|uniref:ornithine cyclodeaminase family protein n=1 Tax=Acidisphaera sp. L21 TaxID=1641851 RepID=UPI00131B1A45|nr:ornithine cyclodeaminase family protein [Acidisphaera sp. L21]